MSQSTHGIIAAPCTPFRADGTLDLRCVERQAQLLVAHGVIGAFVCGTTGEGPSLTLDERMQVAERWIQLARCGLKVFVHVGHNCLYDARALATHAAQHGADAVSATAPSFLRPHTVKQLVDFLEPIAKAASPLPFYYYHIPSLSGVQLSMVELLRQAGQRIDNFCGIKYTHHDLMEYQQCLTFDGGRYDILFGRDEILLAALAMGARGAVGSTYNFSAPLYYRIMRAHAAGNCRVAEQHSQQAVKLVDLLHEYGVLAACKAAMALYDIDCGPPRPPISALSELQRRELLQRIAALGVLDKSL